MSYGKALLALQKDVTEAQERLREATNALNAAHVAVCPRRVGEEIAQRRTGKIFKITAISWRGYAYGYAGVQKLKDGSYSDKTRDLWWIEYGEMEKS